MFGTKTHICDCETKLDDGRTAHCARRAVVKIDGKLYCEQHEGQAI